eukprot:3613401-Lingulodinium_polyedra.AAC.1
MTAQDAWAVHVCKVRRSMNVRKKERVGHKSLPVSWICASKSKRGPAIMITRIFVWPPGLHPVAPL